jgi:hypothetical protein
MPALSPMKKESVGLGGSRMGTKENEIAKAGSSWECCGGKKMNTYCYSEIFLFLKFRLTLKPAV